MKKLRKKYGSVLIFSLIILFVATVAALGIASSTLVARKMSGTTEKSTQSFQVADSGAEIILQKIYKDKTLTNLQSLAVKLGTNCIGSGVIASSIEDGKDYSVTFYDDATPPNQLDCSKDISEVREIKSVGKYGQANRAIKVAVAAEGSWECHEREYSQYNKKTKKYISYNEYKAESNGFFTASVSCTDRQGTFDACLGAFKGYTGPSEKTNQLIAEAGGHYLYDFDRPSAASFTIPVKKGNYYRADFIYDPDNTRDSEVRICWFPID